MEKKAIGLGLTLRFRNALGVVLRRLKESLGSRTFWKLLLFGLGPKWTGRLFAWLYVEAPRDSNRDAPTILCLCRRSLSEDITSLENFSNDFIFARIGNSRLANVVVAIMGAELSAQGRINIRAIGSADKVRLLGFGQGLLEYVKKNYNLQLILAANFNYFQDVPIKLACAEAKLPFIVLSREGARSHSGSVEMEEYYRSQRSLGHQDFVTHFLAMNAFTRDAAIRGLGLEESRVHSVGYPRLQLLSEGGSGLSRRRTTLVSFGMPEYEAEDEFIATIRSLDRLEVQGATTKLQVWAKNSTDRQRVDRAFRALGRRTPILFGNYASFRNALADSSVVITAGSMALLESLFFPNIILVPNWGALRVVNDRTGLFEAQEVALRTLGIVVADSLQMFQSELKLISIGSMEPPGIDADELVESRLEAFSDSIGVPPPASTQMVVELFKRAAESRGS